LQRLFLATIVNPPALAPYTVLRFPFDFGNGPEPKYFVLLGHVADVACLIKATSNTLPYDNDPDRMDGCVCYEPRACAYFRRRTVIEPDNQFEVRHYMLKVHATRGCLQVCGLMPPDFENRLRAAIRNSFTLDKRKKEWLARCLPWVNTLPT
jgi:hypothetical protein